MGEGALERKNLFLKYLSTDSMDLEQAIFLPITLLFEIYQGKLVNILYNWTFSLEWNNTIRAEIGTSREKMLILAKVQLIGLSCHFSWYHMNHYNVWDGFMAPIFKVQITFRALKEESRSSNGSINNLG